jgi:hypothetical protein
MTRLESGIVSVKLEDGLIKVKSTMGVDKQEADRRFGELLGVIRDAKQQGRPALVLIDMSDISRLSLASRRRIMKFLSVRPDKVAYFGEIFSIELLLGYLAKNVGFVKVGIFRTEEEAKGYLGVKP